MVQFEQRVAHLEGRVEGQARMLTDVVDAVRYLETRMEQRFDGLEQRFSGVDVKFTGLDARFGGIDHRFNTIEGRVTALDQKVDRKFDSLDRKLETGFLWLAGIQFATLVALIGSFIAR